MNCEEFMAKLDQDGLTEQEKREMDEHAAGCPACLVKADLRAFMPDEEVPRPAALKWRQAVTEEARGKKVRRFPVWARYAGAAAALVVLTVGALQVGKMNLSAPALNQPAGLSDTGSASPMYLNSGQAKANSGVFPAEYYAGAALPEEAEKAFGAYDDMAYEEDRAEEASEESAEAEMDQAFSGSAERTEKIVRSAVVGITTQAFDEDLSRIENGILAQNGQISSSSVEQRTGGSRRASLTAQVPTDALDAFLESLGSVSGRITRRDVGTEDITGQYYDIQARLDNALIKRDRLKELMNRADSVSDLMQIENSLSDTQSTIDYLTGRMNSLDTSVSFSAVFITLTEETREQAVQQSGSFSDRLRNGMSLSVSAVWGFLQNACLFLLMALPWLAAPAVILLTVHLIVRQIRKRRNVS